MTNAGSAPTKLQGVILDWSGTTVDYGCFAPAVVFVKVFENLGIHISMEEARGPMGLYKRDHITQITQLPAVIERWQQVHGRPPQESDIDTMYNAFVPRQLESIIAYPDLIPGALETVTAFRQRGLKIGSSTGYTRAMMEKLLPEVQKRGYAPDSLVCPDDVGGGRPAPWMAYKNAMILGIYPMWTMVKIGDTVPDVEEGLNAGMWTIALAKTGNELGMSEAEVNALSAEQLQARLEPIIKRFKDAGAHYVVNGLSDVLPVFDEIETRLQRGERPW